MAARRWRENEDEGKCRDGGCEIEPRRRALGRKCCARHARIRADAERERRRKRKIPPPAADA